MTHKHPLRHRIKKFMDREFYMLGIAAIISFVSGVVVGQENIWNYVYLDDFGFSPADASLAASNLNIPWSIKPLWGILCDNVPIFGYRRKSYLIIMAILAFGPLFAFGVVTPSTGLGLGMIFILRFSMSFQSVVGQALVAENSIEINKRKDITEEEKTRVASRGVSLFFGCKYFGQIVFSVICTIWLTEAKRHKFLFYTSFILIPVFLSSFLIPEKPKKAKKREVTARLGSLVEVSIDASLHQPIMASRQQVADLENRSPLENLKKTWNFVKTPVVYYSMILAFLGNFSPTFAQTKFDYYTKHLDFDASFMSTLTLLTSIATVCGIIIYDRLFRNINIKKYYICTIILYFFLKLSLLILIFRLNDDIGIPDKVFAALDQFVTDLGGELKALPVLILACRICPKNIEATIFSLLLAFNNAAALLADDMGAGVVGALGITSENYGNLWVTAVVAGACQLLPLLILWKIDYKSALKVAEESNKQDKEAETPADVDETEKDYDKSFPIQQDEGLNLTQSQDRRLLQNNTSV